MTTVEEHNAFIDMIAALPPAEARSVLAYALTVLHDGDLPTAEAWRLAGIAMGHLDEMRIHTTDELARAEAACGEAVLVSGANGDEIKLVSP